MARAKTAQQRVQPWELRIQDCAGKFGYAEVLARENWLVVFEFVFARVASDIVIHASSGKKAIVIGQHGAAFARVQILVLIEAEGPRIADGANPAPAICNP